MRVWANLYVPKVEISQQTLENIFSNLAHKFAQTRTDYPSYYLESFKKIVYLGSTDVSSVPLQNHMFGDIFLCLR